jgi:uncharacterized protein YjbI with pentapeptide repeats
VGGLYMQKIEINFEDLDGYSKHLRDNPQSLISLNEYIAQIKNIPQEVMADLSKIKFSENPRIDLTNANLSGCILDGLEFSGKYVIIKGADIRGASINNTKFTDHISLAGTKLGSLTLSRDVFFNCQLKDAEYSPSLSDTIMVSVTNKQLQDFLNLEAPVSLNDYLNNLLKEKYPKNCKIVADLSGRTIDSLFSNKDISGANLRNATITGKITNLSMRDCLTHETLFSNCHLINPDLRGTALVDKSSGGQGYEAAIFSGEIIFDQPKTSLGINNISLLEDNSLVPLQNNSSFSVNDPLFDPCYIVNSNDPNIRESIKFTRRDVESYAAYCISAPGEVQSFNQWKKLPKNSIADLSELDLSNIDGLNKGKFEHCNLSLTNFSGNDLDEITFKHCNLTAANFNKNRNFLTSVFFTTKKTTLINAKFEDCNLNCATLDNVDATGVNFTNVIGLNIKAKGLIINNVIAKNINFSGSYLPELEAISLKANESNWSYAYCKSANYTEAELNGSNFAFTDCTKALFASAKLNYANFLGSKLNNSDLTEAELNKARMAANIEYAKMTGTKLSDADLEGLYGEARSKGVDFISALISVEQYHYAASQARQEMEENKKSIYNKYSIGIIGATIATSALIPATIYALLPAALAATTMAIAAPIIAAVSVIIIGAIAVEKTIEHFTAYNIGITKSIADIFGAEKIVKKKNAKLDAQENEHNQLSKQIIIKLDALKRTETQIKAETIERQNLNSRRRENPEHLRRKKPSEKSFIDRAKSMINPTRSA